MVDIKDDLSDYSYFHYKEKKEDGFEWVTFKPIEDPVEVKVKREDVFKLLRLEFN